MEFNQENNRIYAQDEAGEIIAEITFPERAKGVVAIDHTFVADSLRGQGIAGKLMEACHAQLRADGRKAIPVCAYAVKWFQEHPEKADIVEA
ncbi:MAG: N-acetyltransferase [Azoarcus sp.]|jgi:predicted GNAT family acetyltransferase|nr:N-acetyltransferase [Azoarcus sp.]